MISNCKGKANSRWPGLLAMQIVEGTRRVCARKLRQNDRTARMGIDEVCKVVDFVIDNAP